MMDLLFTPPGPPSTALYTTLGSAHKYSTTPALDTDEESLAEFIGGLSSSTQDGSSPDRTPRLLPAQPARAPEPPRPAVRVSS